VYYATSRKIVGSVPDEIICFFFFNLLNHSNRSMALGSSQPLTLINTSVAGGKAKPNSKPDNFTAICDPIV
jgi:hypothetical protein